ncbi:hydantoinase/oxoprolinase family protein [Methylobacterium nodulans]|uniref:Hydantoinase/oxoprolinase n=1 Tax=Methylobacterium nodulans (strain LMG 21967 / CNCM I-2342 / ORS 2060) TaxID=460265 RepID=B8IW02_METNO|nr:hydantoinase/oxoprolinase family protein [Methylobacterium nodulans]ACL62592.1 Hydantoinase/oxoprolinase [Methylobacterium nodulans ORS 2060]
MGYRVGVDIGGSFTDFALFDEATQSLRTLKVFSRPDEPGAEVMEGVHLVGERYGIAPSDISYFTHGTTVGINTVIQRKGLRLALFTTENFRDVLELARLKIPDMYNLLSKRPEPLITRDRVFGIAERLNADGSVQRPIDEASVGEAVAAARAAGAEGIVVAFLHAYRNPVHEQAAKAVIARLAPDVPVFLSSETWPIVREYERTITAVIGAYVQPRVAHYLGSLQAALKTAGVDAEPRLTKSNGGVMTAEQGKSECVQMILSGTASGVIGAAYVAETCGVKHCMSLDIGGTSADVAVIIDGQPQYGIGELIGDFQIYIQSVSVSSIGEGGGSIAWIDAQGVLKVGPESAGSRPGPACYGRGGTRPTITDAFAALGLVGLAEIGYSAVTIDREKARAAVATLATPLGRTIEETAEAIIRIAVSGMYTDTSALVSRFGIDPRDFSCLAFGGAGPMMACFLARELNMRDVLVPPTPGVLSALGGLIADIKSDFIKTLYTDLVPDLGGTIRAEFADLEAQAVSWLRDDQGYAGDYTLSHSAELRYKGQSFELDTKIPAGPASAGDVAAIAEAFHAEHQRVYGHCDRRAAVQIMALRLIISGGTAKPGFLRQPLVEGVATPLRHAEVWLDGAMRSVGVFHRADLKPGQSFAGPAVVTQDDCTTVVPPGMAVRVDEYTNLRIAQEAAR